MSWVRIDEEAPYHPKVVQAGVAAFGMFCAGLCYANRFLTDGFIPVGTLTAVFPGERWSVLMKLAVKLVEVGLWEKKDDGWVIHDYHHYQPTKSEVLTERATKHAARVAAGRVRASMGGRIAGRFASRTPANHQQAAGDVLVTRDQQTTSPDPARPDPTRREADHAAGGHGLGNGHAPPPAMGFQIPEAVVSALERSPTLGKVPRLRRPDWWQAELRANPGLDLAREVLKAEAYMTANPQKRYKHPDRFLHGWLGRADRDE